MDFMERVSRAAPALTKNGRDASRTTEGPKQSEWEAQKEEIRLLYQQYPLKQVQQILEQRGFVATQRMFKSRLSQWGYVKNSSDKEYQVAMLLLQDRKEAGKHDTGFVINGHNRSVKDLRKYIKGRKMTDEQFTQLARQNEAAGDLRDVYGHVQCGTPDPELSDSETHQSPTSASSQTESPNPLQPLPPSPESCLLPLDISRCSSLAPIQIPHRTLGTHKGRRNSIKIRKNRLSDPSAGRIASTSESVLGGQLQMEGAEKPFTPGSMHDTAQPFYTPRHSPSCDHFGLEDVDMLACSAVHSNSLPATFGVDNQDALKLLSPQLSRTASGTNLICGKCSETAASHFSRLQHVYDSPPAMSGSRPVSSHQSPRAILNPSDDVALDAFQIAPSSKDHDHCVKWTSLCFLTCFYSTKHETSPDDIQAKTLAEKSLDNADTEFEAILRSDDPMIVLTLNNTLTILHQHNQKNICEKIMKSTAAVAERVVGVYSPIGILTRYLGYAANPEKLMKQTEITSQRLRDVWDEFVQTLPDGDRDQRSIGALYCLGHSLNVEGLRDSSQDKYRESASVLHQCYRLSCEILSKHHLQSIMALAGLRLSLELQGEVQAAIRCAETAIKDSLLSLGVQHPKRLELMRNLALSYFKVGRETDAEDLYWRVLEGRVNMLGCQHEYTEAIAYDLQEYLMKQNRWTDDKGEPTPDQTRLEDFFMWDLVDPESADEESAHNPLKEAARKRLLKAY